MKCFGKDPLPMLVSIADRHISGPEEVIDAIHFVHSYNKTELGTNSTYDVLFGTLLECRISEWIRGKDIAEHPHIRQVIPEDRLERMRGNPNARGELFLDGISSSHVPPLTGLSISVRFISQV